MPRISAATISKLINSVNLSQHIAKFVTLKRSGQNFLGPCPFHGDSTPSFYVYDKDQRFHCFGCQKGGNLIDFEMNRSQQSFVDAIGSLADQYNIPVEYAESASSQSYQAALKHKHDLRSTLSWAHSVYSDSLWSELGNAAVHYLTEKRGLSRLFCKDMGLGWAPADRTTLVNAARKRGYPLQLLQDAGLIKSRSDGSFYDFFSARVMFPVYDEQGHVVAFGGRILPEHDPENRQPKYLNSPESLVFSKSKTLFHFFFSKKNAQKSGFIIVVEGYLDCLSLYQAGVNNVVAVLGTALSSDHVKLISRSCGECAVWFDNDLAGANARLRTFKMGFPLNLVTFSSVRSDGLAKDPDEILIKHGRTVVDELIEQRRPLLLAVIKDLTEKSTSRENLLRSISHEIVKTIQSHPDPLIRSDALGNLSQQLQIPGLLNQVPFLNVQEEGSQRELVPPGTLQSNLKLEQAFTQSRAGLKLPRWEITHLEELRLLVALCFAKEVELPMQLRAFLSNSALQPVTSGEKSHADNVADDADIKVTALAVTHQFSSIGLCVLEDIFGHFSQYPDKTIVDYFLLLKGADVEQKVSDVDTSENSATVSECFFDYLCEIFEEFSELDSVLQQNELLNVRDKNKIFLVFGAFAKSYVRWWMGHLIVAKNRGSMGALLTNELGQFELSYLNQRLSLLTRQFGALTNDPGALAKLEEQRRWFFNQRVRLLVKQGMRG